jgi:ADP-ribose pyrophosphatase YjhB (NUDIX family)
MKQIKTLFQGEFVQIASPSDHPYEMQVERDMVHALIFQRSTNTFFIRKELVPPYAHKDPQEREFWHTVLSGGIEAGESPLQAVVREIREEAGIDILKTSLIEARQLFHGPFNKATTARVWVFYFEADEFARCEAVGDGTEYEEKARTISVSLEVLKEILKGTNVDYLLSATYGFMSLFLNSNF